MSEPRNRASSPQSHNTVPAPTKEYSRVFGDQSDDNGCLVLVVEDSPPSQEIATAMLEWLGCKVVVAENGILALDAVQQAEFDLILMDCQMPEMDGLEATRQMRLEQETEGGRHIPIVALTANAVPGDREKCVKAGMDDYISKPVHLTDLVNALNNWCTTGVVLHPACGATMTETEETICEIDPEAVKKIRDLQRPGQESVVLRIVDAYLDSSRLLVDELSGALDGGDEQTAQHSAHTLKSSSAVLGASKFAAICKQIEAHARQENLAETHPLMPHFNALYASTCASLLNLREQEEVKSSD